MSGFAGVVSTDGAPPDEHLLKRMAERLAFRGPDGTHIWKQPGAGFCFTFLRTGPAPQCPSQPCSLDGNIWLLGDVRLDGRDDLRRKLEQHGDTIAADATDEELVLRVWRRWGEPGLPELMGDYAFALWDAEARQLWCVRDLMGARPFFYARVGERFYFSNTLNALRCATEISSELDLHFIGDFLLEGWCLDPARTAFRDLSRLPAGHVLRHSEQELVLRRFISLPIEEPLRLKSDQEYVERFGELLEQAVADRLPRGPAAIFMSGGLDSTSVAAVAVNLARKNSWPLALRAFTIDYQPLYKDQEGRLAATVAEHLGIPINILRGDSTLPFAESGSAQRLAPEPCSEPYWSLYLQHNRQVAAHAHVVLTGHGGDGVLTGQSWPYLRYLARRLKVATILRDFGGYILRHGRFPPLRGGFRLRLRRWIRPINPITNYPPWLTPEFEDELQLRERWLQQQTPGPRVHPCHPDAYEALTDGFWPGFLEGEDPTWSGVATEVRAPLLDLRITGFLLRVPAVPLCIGKELIRRRVRGLLPEEIRLRPKTPFGCDQLELQVKNNSWTPFPLPQPDHILARLVDWKNLETTLKSRRVVFPWQHLRPISLLYWLRGIEISRGIG